MVNLATTLGMKCMRSEEYSVSKVLHWTNIFVSTIEMTNM